MTKSELRKIYLAKRQNLSHSERDPASAKIAANFFQNFDLGSIHFLHCFIPIEKFNEVDTRPIFQRIWSDFSGITTLVPRIVGGSGEMESVRFGQGTELVRNRWQIGEPRHNDTVDANKIDIVIVPLVCFDRRGHRVGYGGGYYDRFLVRCREDCLKIGLSFFEPVDEIIDSHEGDVTLDHCVMPTSVFTINKNEKAGIQ